MRIFDIVEIDSDGLFINGLQFSEAVALIEDLIEDYRIHLADFDCVLFDIEFDFEEVEIFIEEDDSVAQIVESLQLFYVFI